MFMSDARKFITGRKDQVVGKADAGKQPATLAHPVPRYASLMDCLKYPS
jgi:hypothetical protein